MLPCQRERERGLKIDLKSTIMNSMQKYEALKIPNLSDIISFMLNSINTVPILRNIPLPVASLTMDISVV